MATYPLVAGYRQSAISAFCRPTTQTSSITNRLVAIGHTKPVIATLVPKLVAMATSLDPRSRLCGHRIAWSQKPTPRIKQRVASCHTAEGISIQSLPTPPHTPKGQPISGVGWWDSHHVWYGRLHPVVLDFLIFPALGNGGLKVSILGPKIAKIFFLTLKFLGVTYEHPYRR